MIENEEPRLEEAELTPAESRPERIHFPWTIAIIVGVLALLIIACFIVIWVLEH